MAGLPAIMPSKAWDAAGAEGKRDSYKLIQGTIGRMARFLHHGHPGRNPVYVPPHHRTHNAAAPNPARQAASPAPGDHGVWQALGILPRCHRAPGRLWILLFSATRRPPEPCPGDILLAAPGTPRDPATALQEP